MKIQIPLSPAVPLSDNGIALQVKARAMAWPIPSPVPPVSLLFQSRLAHALSLQG